MAKLVEILAQELKEWVGDWPAIGQAKDGTLHREPFLGGHTPFSLTRASDYVQAIVTRAEWQAAVDALKPDAQRFAEDYVEANKDRCVREWNGEGLPPVGTTCDLVYQGCEQGQVEVLFCSRQTTVCLNLEDGREQFGETFDYEFRPIRTPEQIAAEEREKAVEDMLLLDPYDVRLQLGMMSRKDFCGALYDAGYRKQEQK